VGECIVTGVKLILWGQFIF